MSNKQSYNSGVEEIFSNFSKDPCLKENCKSTCPIGFTSIRAVSPRSGEFRIDFSGCNFRCPFCWTVDKPKLWSAEEIYKKVQCKFDHFNTSGLDIEISYLRLTGGEPLLTENRINHLIEIFDLIDRDITQSKRYQIWKIRKAPSNIAGRRNVKIQTNGSNVTKLIDGFISKLTKYNNLAFTFEVSLKGIRPEEFTILSGCSSKKLFFDQIRALSELVRYEKLGLPFFVRGIIGIFHSAQHDLVFPDNIRMFLEPSPEFIEIAKTLLHMPRKQERFYVEPLRFTEQMSSAKIKCQELGIISQTNRGRSIKPGKKLSLMATYLKNLLD